MGDELESVVDAKALMAETRSARHRALRHWPLMQRWVERRAPGIALLVLALACAPSVSSVAASPTAAPTGGAAARASPALATGRHGAVTSAEANASAIGKAVLLRGGNAVDAAVAVAFALGVTYPSAANIGGGGFMLVRSPDGAATAIDYREVAPRAARRDMYLDARGEVTDRGQAGPLAAGIPGVVAGLALAHERFGTRPWSELVAPALALARDGFVLDGFLARELARATELTREYAARLASGASSRPGGASALDAALAAMLVSFGKADGHAHAPGERWRQPALAETLAAVADGGARAFYDGPLAARLAAGVQAMGGIWTPEDLAGYRAVERAPIAFSYHGYDIVTMPPPSAGGIVLRQILAAADVLGVHTLDWDSAERVHLYIEILRRTYADRNRWIGDPDFVHVPLAELLDPARIARRVADIDPERATPSSEIAPGQRARAEPPHTTHFSIVDARGMAVANTFTLNGDFGALVQVPSTGVTLNNQMDDFTAKPGAPNLAGLVQGEPNAIEPGKRMSSSMSPTIITRDGALRAVLGSPGGPTITTTVAQIAMQILDHGRSLERAVAAPRIHNQWLPDETWYEAGVPEPALERLRRLGHRLTLESEPIGHAHCIERDPASGLLRAVADVARGGGGAEAY